MKMAAAPYPECHICASSVKSKYLCCRHCDAISCNNCIERYLLETPQLPHCPNCREAFTYGFLITGLTKKFAKETLREHQVDLLLESEKSLLPETARKMDAIKDVDPEVHELRIQLYNSQIRRLRTRIAELLHLIESEKDTIEIMEAERARILSGESAASLPKEESTKGRIWPCPKADCRGFIMKDWKCGVCSTAVCNVCRSPRQEGHICKPEDVESARAIAADSKPCPKCKVPTFKAEGCYQCWCPMCHTRFDWKTLEIIRSGHFHNPMEQEWLRTQKGTKKPKGEVGGCGTLPGFSDYSGIKFERSYFEAAYKVAAEVQHSRDRAADEIDTLTSIKNNEETRIMYLKGEITPELFRKNIAERSLRISMCRNLTEVYQAMATVLTDLLARAVHNSSQVKEIKEEMEAFREYINKQFAQMKDEYGRAMPNFDENWVSRSGRNCFLNVR